MIKACIFDLDGTLADTLSTIANYGNSALKANSYNEIEVEKYKYLAGDGRDELIKRMLKTVGDSDLKGYKNVGKTYDTLYELDVIGMTTVFDGIKELLMSLKKKHIRIAVLSNKPNTVVPTIIDNLFGRGFFDACLGQIDNIKRKPSPDGALIIAEQFNIKPNECLYIGDTNVDMETGNSAGMNTIGVLWGFRDRQELERSGAKYIVEKPIDILSLPCFN